VPRAALRTGAGVQAVVGALDVPERPDQLLADTLVDTLRDKELLLVVDNCEHLVEAVAWLVDALLSSCHRSPCRMPMEGLPSRA
jgi:predicted ATPase